MAIEQAVLALQDEIASFNQGTAVQPAVGTTDWYRLRALTLGLTYLQRVQQLALHDDPAAAERLYRACYKTHTNTDAPEALVIIREVLPEPAVPA